MKEYNPVTNESGQCMALARASVGIYLSLAMADFPSGSSVMVPANLCYAGIYPVIYAGLQPRFCDVDPYTGNITLDSFSAAYSGDVVAAVVPHMYGNPVEQMPEIVHFCKTRNILLIEDCASAMGAESDNYCLGSMGDYVVYSTGYSKTMDLGFGGFLFSSKNDLTRAEKMEEALPDLTPDNDRNMAFFSRLYRLMRNEGSNTAIERMICKGMAETCRSDFLHRIPEERKQWLFSQVEQLPQIIQKRRQAVEYYERKLKECQVLRYPYSKTAVPWRYNILIEGTARRNLIQACLSASLPVSDWYPRVTNLFGNTVHFPGAQKHEQMILNFPLLIAESEIDRICENICEFAKTQPLEV